MPSNEIHLIMIEAHKLERILRQAQRRKRIGTFMIVSGAWMMLLSARRRRDKDNGSWANAAR